MCREPKERRPWDNVPLDLAESLTHLLVVEKNSRTPLVYVSRSQSRSSIFSKQGPVFRNPITQGGTKNNINYSGSNKKLSPRSVTLPPCHVTLPSATGLAPPRNLSEVLFIVIYYILKINLPK